MRYLPAALSLLLGLGCSGNHRKDIGRHLGAHDAAQDAQLDGSDDDDEPSEPARDASVSEDADAVGDAAGTLDATADAASLDAGATGSDGEVDAGDAGTSEAAPPSDAATDADAALPIEAGPVMLRAPDAPFSAGISGTWCGLAYDHVRDSIWVIECFGAVLDEYSPNGVLRSSLARPAEAADDVDLDMAPAQFQLAGSAVSEDRVVFINGETNAAEFYALTPASDAGTSVMLASTFGNSHVVGGAYHLARGTLFAVQDRVPGGGSSNTVAEIDVVNGSVLRSFSTLPGFDVNYGDLEVCQSNGHLFLVSSNETSVAEFTPEGTLVAKHPLPTAVTSLSGIGIDDATGTTWVCGTSRQVWRLLDLPCPRRVR